VLGVTPGWWGYAIVNGNELWEQGVEPAWAEWDDWKGAPREVLHPWGGVYVFGPTVHAGTNRVPVTLEQTIPASPIAGVAWSQRVESTVAFEGVSSIEECMTPVDNRDIRRRIVNGLTISPDEAHLPLRTRMGTIGG
jgi:hypothetical protein